MMEKLNCWEFLKCGCEPNGKNIDTIGLCPVTIHVKYNGINNGKNAGRMCWAVTGTLCKEIVACKISDTLEQCINCDFLKYVHEQEDRQFILLH